MNDGNGEKTLQNVLIGEVWLCSGQSNMEFPIRGSWGRLPDADEVVATMQRPALRLLQIRNTASLTPLDDADVEYGWVESSPAAESFSAIGYLYGRMLQDSLNVPVGVIDATWGGTAVEAWTPRKSLKDVSKTGMLYEEPESNNHPTVLYNAMINPLTTMPLAGVIWYQGCQNVGRAEQYEICFKKMIEGWRKAFDSPDMPFYFVQLAGFLQPVVVQPESEWAQLRYAQAKALELPNTGMVTAVDLGNPVDIHPTNKAEVARRLGILALDRSYGRKQTCEAPVCTNVDNDGKGITLTFDAPVKAVGGVATGFIIGDEKGIWASANATMIDDRSIRLSSQLIDKPVAVRYSWADYPGGNLYGANSLPVAPFATDGL